MKQLNNLKKLSEASFFNKETLQRVIGVSDNSLYSNIKRWLKRGEIIQLKRGLYVSKEYVQKVKDKNSYVEFIANNLNKPSYLTGEYVLQKYNILTESVFSITSVTLKKTNLYQNDLGLFLYSSIRENLFCGYKIKAEEGYEIKEATKAKALFDYLYFRLWRLPKVTKDYILSLRLNILELMNGDLNEFEKYIKILRLEKMNVLPKILKEIKNDN